MDQKILAGFDVEVPTVQLSLWTFGWPILPTQLASHSSISRPPHQHLDINRGKQP